MKQRMKDYEKEISRLENDLAKAKVGERTQALLCLGLIFFFFRERNPKGMDRGSTRSHVPVQHLTNQSHMRCPMIQKKMGMLKSSCFLQKCLLCIK